MGQVRYVIKEGVIYGNNNCSAITPLGAFSAITPFADFLPD